MANSNENLEKIKTAAKDAAQKVQESEAVSKIKDVTADMSQKLKENETVMNVTDKVNQNEQVQKIKNSKHSKLISFGALILILVLLFGLGSAIFGDKKAKVAEEVLKKETIILMEEAGATNIKVKTKLVAKNETADLYCFETTETCKYDGKKKEHNSYILVYSDGEDAFLLRQYEYEEENKKDIREIAFAALARG